MDASQEILYNGFPRSVGSTDKDQIRQHFVHSESEFDLWFDKLKNERNMYSSICRFRSDMRPILGDIPFDLDSPLKDSVFEEGTTDAEKIEMMKDDGDLLKEVLGDVWKDAQKLMTKCIKEDIPAIGVFSGLGVHIHLLFQEEVQPTKKKVSISQWLIDECDLFTHDTTIITDTRRILRVPNSQRISDDERAGVWCIPMTEREIINNSIFDVLERTSRPKTIEYHDRYKPENRPEMVLKEGYEEVKEDTAGTVPIDDAIEHTNLSDLEEELVREHLMMPCISERFFSSNPHHMVRFSGTTLLYQAGYTPIEVRQIIRNIGWVDYDPDITKKMTDQIWNREYSELPCSKLQTLGLCVQSPEFEKYGDEPSDCETYKWMSGESNYGKLQ